MTEEDRTRLLHMSDAAQKAVTLVTGVTLEQYTAADNFPVRFATERLLSIVGEAAHHVSDELKAESSEIVWRQIAGMRNHLVHGYMATDDEVVWKTVVEDAPLLLAQLRSLLEEG